ncbi:hypothetical protein Slin14017_G092980 [Septoria linicola]|nr:hypothetical protein Slin14017_G092980 [Septoria linicola]
MSHLHKAQRGYDLACAYGEPGDEDTVQQMPALLAQMKSTIYAALEAEDAATAKPTVDTAPSTPPHFVAMFDGPADPLPGQEDESEQKTTPLQIRPKLSGSMRLRRDREGLKLAASELDLRKLFDEGQVDNEEVDKGQGDKEKVDKGQGDKEKVDNEKVDNGKDSIHYEEDGRSMQIE